MLRRVGAGAATVFWTLPKVVADAAMKSWMLRESDADATKVLRTLRSVDAGFALEEIKGKTLDKGSEFNF